MTLTKKLITFLLVLLTGCQSLPLPLPQATAAPTITAGPSGYQSLELTWQGKVLGQSLGAQLGYEKQSAAGTSGADGAYGFIQWRKAL